MVHKTVRVRVSPAPLHISLNIISSHRVFSGIVNNAESILFHSGAFFIDIIKADAVAAEEKVNLGGGAVSMFGN